MPIAVGLAARESASDLSGLAQSLDGMAGLGVDCVELPAYAFDLVLGGRPMEARIRELEAACRGRPFRFSVHGPLAINFMAPPTLLPRYLDMTAAFIDITARIGASHLVLHAGMLQASELHGREDAYSRQRDWLARAGDRAEARGVVLCIENLFDYPPFAHTPAPSRLAREIADIGHDHVRATFDFSHGFIHAAQHDYDFVKSAAALAPHAVHLHLHDAFGIPDIPWAYKPSESAAFGAGDLHLPLGWGALPWDRIAAECRFPADVLAIHELSPFFWRDREEAIANSRAFTAKLQAG